MDFMIQVAGVLDPDEGRMLAEEGATHVGLPLRLDVHAPDVDDRTARDIVRALPASAVPVLITYLRDADEILDLAGYLDVRAVQLHAPVGSGLTSVLRRRMPGLFLIRSLVVHGGEGPVATARNAERLAGEVAAHAPFVDAFLTDTFDPATGASGATGRTHDWDVSRELVRLSPRPVILAGGLNPGNVAEAVRTVRPAGVDAHTGLEDAQGRKVRELVRGFVKNARQAAGV